MEKPIWFAGACDSLLAKVKAWHEYYDLGTIYSTRKFLNEQFKIEDKVTKRVHAISFTKQEITYFKIFIDYYCPNKLLTQEIDGVTAMWKSAPLANYNMRKLTLSFFPEHVKLIYDTLLKAKKEATMGKSMDTVIEEAKKSGKDLFEV